MLDTRNRLQQFEGSPEFRLLDSGQDLAIDPLQLQLKKCEMLLTSLLRLSPLRIDSGLAR